MTAHATAGVILAWNERRFPLQYTLPVFDENRKPIGVLDPIEIVLEAKDDLDRARDKPLASGSESSPRGS